MRAVLGFVIPFVWAAFLAPLGFHVQPDTIFLASCLLIGLAVVAEELRRSRKEK